MNNHINEDLLKTLPAIAPCQGGLLRPDRHKPTLIIDNISTLGTYYYVQCPECEDTGDCKKTPLAAIESWNFHRKGDK